MKRVLALVVSLCAVLALAMTAGGCEAIVSDNLPGYTCSDNAGCPAGQYCYGNAQHTGTCQTCTQTDTCDGIDNDCNGKVDDGPLSDHDNDGYTICGHADANGKPIDVDCNDNDPNVHPGATEVCDGIDNDCDGTVDNPDTVCPAGQTCAPQLKQCVSATQCNSDNCMSPKQCDPNTQQCVDPTSNFAVGHDCTSDKECSSSICGFPALLNGAITGQVCTSLCCTSNDCPTGFVCDATGSGGRYCIDPTSLSLSAPGTGPGGTSCGDGTACRSGNCVAGRCLDTCCSDSDCQNGTNCTFQTIRGHQGFWCGTSSGGGNPNSYCNGDNSCRSDFCANYSDDARCVAPCCTSAGGQCGALFGGTVPIACVQTRIEGGSDQFDVCSGATGTRSAAFGAACSTNDDCLSGQCDTTTSHKCTDVCCVDANCPQPSNKCTPDATGLLRCALSP